MDATGLSAVSSSAKGEVVRGTLVLERAYELGRRVGGDSLATTYEAVQRPFGRAVWVRLYDRLDELGLSEPAVARLKALIEAGGEGPLAVDYGELDGGTPFLVLDAPRGSSLRDWWQAGPRTPERLARLGQALCGLCLGASAARRVQLTLDSLYAEGPVDGDPVLALQAIGDVLSRAEVREMTGLVQRDRVLGVPPECYRPPTSEEDGLEHGVAADGYRVAAVLYQVWTGDHPLFPVEADVATSVAELVNEVGRRPAPLGSGVEALDELVGRAVGLDARQRPAVTELRRALAAIAAGATPSEPTAGESRDEPGARGRRAGQLPRPMGWAIRLVVLAIVAVGTYLLSHLPPRSAAVIVTSDPSGVLFEQVDGDGAGRPLGRTPLLLSDQPLSEPLSIRPVYEDGRRGAVQSLRPDQLESLDTCRSLHVRWEPPH